MTASTTQRGRPPGRRSGDSGTRDAILDAALGLFAENGFEGTSLRAIAGVAGVDPALIRHFYGDKQTLFATAVAHRTAIPARLAAAIGDVPTTGHALADAYLRLWEEPDTGPIIQALVRSATASQQAADMLREVLVSRVQSQVTGGPERLTSVALAAAHLFGIAMARHVLAIPPIVDLTHDELVDRIAPTIQRYLTDTHR